MSLICKMKLSYNLPKRMYHDSKISIKKIKIMTNKNMKKRTRFAPSPTGKMHVGNARSAIISYMLAMEDEGSFILRIEDTDPARSEYFYTRSIDESLKWLGVLPSESPELGGPHAPYCQSERSQIYEIFLADLQKKKLVYRCFKSEEQIKRERETQIALKQPQRYIRQQITIDEENKLLEEKKPFVWRVAITKKSTIFNDTAQGVVEIDLSNFSDFSITRQDGSFTFVFANFVDDYLMNISHVIRGIEHFSTTVLQAYMYSWFSEHSMPLFTHLPLLGDASGKKLSKRDRHFSLDDLIEEGYLPEALNNYLLTVGGGVNDGLFSLQEGIKDKIASKIINQPSRMVCFDEKKLEWLNVQWIKKIDLKKFIEELERYYRWCEAREELLNDSELKKIFIKKDYCKKILSFLFSKDMHFIQCIKDECVSLKDAIFLLLPIAVEDFIIEAKGAIPVLHRGLLKIFIEKIEKNLSLPHVLLEDLEIFLLDEKVDKKEFFFSLRFALIGKKSGIKISTLFTLLSSSVIIERIKKQCCDVK